MEYTFPMYYKEFQCIADRCPDTCCAGWQIVIDKRSLKKYKDFPGGFGNRLVNSIDWKEEVFKQYDKRCAFLNEENLCDIYSEAGRDMLCRTCRRYPRHYEEFENIREISLSLSCPEVARMIWNLDEKVTFCNVSKDGPEEEYDDFDFLLFTKLEETRQLLVDVLQNRSIPMWIRMAYALLITYTVQKKIDGNQMFEIDSELEKYRERCVNETVPDVAVGKLKRYAESAKSRFHYRRALFQCLYQLETLDESWTETLKTCEEALYSEGEAAYEDICSRWREYNPKKDIQMEQLMVYFVFTYFCGSVYDEHPLSKLKAAVMHTVLMEELLMGTYEAKGNLSAEEQMKLVYQYAREIEHSDVNLNLVETFTKKNELFRMERMLTIVAEDNCFAI